MEKERASWAKGRGPYNRPIFPIFKQKLAHVTLPTAYYRHLAGSMANCTLGS